MPDLCSSVGGADVFARDLTLAGISQSEHQTFTFAGQSHDTELLRCSSLTAYSDVPAVVRIPQRNPALFSFYLCCVEGPYANVTTTNRFYSDRIAGGDCHHRDPRGDAAPGPGEGKVEIAGD